MPILRRQQPWAKGALALAALLILPAAGCKRAPASPSRPIAKGEQSHSEAAAAHDAARAPVQVPVQAPRFAVQVAAFDDRPSAEALASRLSDHFGLQTDLFADFLCTYSSAHSLRFACHLSPQRRAPG